MMSSKIMFKNCLDIISSFEYSKPSNALVALKGETGVTYKGVYQKANVNNPMWQSIYEESLVLESINKSENVLDKNSIFMLKKGNIKKLSVFLYKSGLPHIEQRVVEVMKKTYWNKLKLDLLNDMSLCLLIFGFSVNVGPKRCALIVQDTLGHVKVDGVIGKKTMKVLKTCDRIGFINDFKLSKIKFYEELVQRKPKLYIYFKGWINRVDRISSIINKIEAES